MELKIEALENGQYSCYRETSPYFYFECKDSNELGEIVSKLIDFCREHNPDVFKRNNNSPKKP